LFKFCFLGKNVGLHLLHGVFAGGRHKIGRIPEMPSPQKLFDFRMSKEQLSGHRALSDFKNSWDVVLRRAADE
jgi:hypothetical protein